MKHKFSFRIYYEDTDAGGVVYYGNYLKFAERARTEFLRECGFENKILQDEQNIMFVVRHADIDYLKPGFLDDNLVLETQLISLKNTSFVMGQNVLRDQEIICAMTITLVCVDFKKVKPAKIPDDIRSAFQENYMIET